MHPTVDNLNNKKKKRETYGNRVVVEIRRSVPLFTLIHQNVYGTRWGPRFRPPNERKSAIVRVQAYNTQTYRQEPHARSQSIANLFIFSFPTPQPPPFFAL